MNQEEDDKVHFATLLQLAQAGFSSIQYIVGMMYFEGRGGVGKDLVEGLRWVYDAKVANHPVAILQFESLENRVAKDQTTGTPTKSNEKVSKLKKILRRNPNCPKELMRWCIRKQFTPTMKNLRLLFPGTK